MEPVCLCWGAYYIFLPQQGTTNLFLFPTPNFSIFFTTRVLSKLPIILSITQKSVPPKTRMEPNNWWCLLFLSGPYSGSSREFLGGAFTKKTMAARLRQASQVTSIFPCNAFFTSRGLPDPGCPMANEGLWVSLAFHTQNAVILNGDSCWVKGW